jgi:hypothetical protein
VLVVNDKQELYDDSVTAATAAGAVSATAAAALAQKTSEAAQTQANVDAKQLEVDAAKALYDARLKAYVDAKAAADALVLISDSALTVLNTKTSEYNAAK